MARDHPSLSAVILTKNEAVRIERCLSRLRWADEILVVDDQSTDATTEICRRFGATVVVRRSEGDFDEQRNAGIDASCGEWIFQLDADEIVPSALRDEIRSVLQQPGDAVAYRVRRSNFFLGRQMRYGGWGWQGVKLFKRTAARYVGHSVHETLKVLGPIRALSHPIEHYPFQSLTQFVDRQNFYSMVEARVLQEQHAACTPRVLRYQLVVRPVKLFWKSYVKKSGWREGFHGLVFGALFAWFHFLKWARYWNSARPDRAPNRAREQIMRPEPVAISEAATHQDERARLSVVVLTKNEEDKIGRCLQSVRWADEVVVVDGLSTDRTVEICRAFGATVVSHAFDGSFATDRNLGLEHATGEWVLQIDADDIVTPEFRVAVEGILRSDSPYAALKFWRRSVLLGRAMRYGGWYYAVPNLVRRDRVRYEGRVHERPRIDGALGELPADIEHHPCEDLSVFVARHNRYTSLQAREFFERGGVIPRWRLWARLWRKPWKTFWKSYVKKQGYREGLHGLVFAILFAGIELIKWAKYWEVSYVSQRTGVLDHPLGAQAAEVAQWQTNTTS